MKPRPTKKVFRSITLAVLLGLESLLLTFNPATAADPVSIGVVNR